MILDHVRPLATPEDIIFRLPLGFSIVFTFLGSVLLVMSMLKLGGIFNIFPIKNLIAGEIVYHPGYDSKSE